MQTDLAAELQAYLARAVPAWVEPAVARLDVLAAGWESDLYAADVEHGPRGARLREPVVARLYYGDSAQPKAVHEFQALRRLDEAGYPVPRVYHLAAEAFPFHRPFILMQRIDGSPLWPLLTSAPANQRRGLLARFCQLFVQLHRLDWRPFAGPDPASVQSPAYAFVDEAVRDARAAVGRLALPGFLPLVDWLEARRQRVPCSAPAVVHGDFHPNNVLIQPDGFAVVIDWTGLRVTDARFDLAWTLLLAYSHGSPAWRDLMLTEYERLAGSPVPELAWFEVYACARRLFDVTVSLSAGAEQMGMRAGAAAQMRQALPALRQVYARLQALTSLAVPEVEHLLSSG